MAPFKSAAGRNVGKPLKSYTTGNIGSTLQPVAPNAMVATGGVTSEPGNGNKYHFLTSPVHTFTIVTTPGSVNVDYVAVGGGGAGGVYPSGNSGGGGGAGGFITGTFPDMAAGTYPITIGEGGATNSSDGTPTIFNSITAYGGGGGSPSYTAGGNPGASGGGGGGAGPTAGGIGDRVVPGGPVIPAPLSPQGNPGGTGGPGSNTGKSGGGGGAGAAGANAATGSGAGGDGLIAFSGDDGIPDSYGTVGPTPGRWFAGGGAGGTYGSTGIGGVGGGGSQLTPQPPSYPGSINGVVNTGGGGGGAQAPTGGTGGSGIVILKYPIAG